MITKAELIRKLARRAGVPDQEAKLFFEIFLKRAVEILKPGSAVFIKQYGYFQLRRGKIDNLTGVDGTASAPVYADLMVFSSEEVKDNDNLFFNIPLNRAQEYHPLDSYFSLSIGKPVIPLKNVTPDEHFVQPSGLELRRLIESKVEKLFNELEIIEDYLTGHEVLLIDASKYNPNQMEMNLSGSISQSAAAASEKEREEAASGVFKNSKNIPWDFGDNLSRELEEESILDITDTNQILFKETIEEQTDEVEKPMPFKRTGTTSRLNEEDFQEVKAVSKQVILPDGNIEDDLNNFLSDSENETDPVPPIEVEEEEHDEGFSQIKFKTATHQLNVPDELNFIPETDEEFNIDEYEVDEVREDEPFEDNLPVIEFAPKKTFDPEEIEIPKKKNWLFVFVVAGLLLVVSAGYFIYQNIDSFISKKNIAQNDGGEKIISSVVDRTFEVPVSYPYNPGGDSLKSVTHAIDLTVPVITQQKENTADVNIKKEDMSSTNKPEPKKVEKIVETPPVEKPVGQAEKVKDFIYKYGSSYFVQVSSWRDKNIADKEVQKLQKKGRTAIIEGAKISGRGTWYRVLVGAFSTLKEAEDFKNKQ